MHFHGRQFIEFAANAVHHANVPMSLHLDHCIEEKDVYLALDLPFDSIMVDASSEDPDKNIQFVTKIVQMARQKGITIEAEMGRIQGGEDGVPTVEMEALYTEPEYAAEFVEKTGIHFLAPSFGNVHGPYPPGGPETFWQLDRLKRIHELVPSVPLVLHGAYPIIDSLVEKTVQLGIRKINFNRNLHDPYVKFISENASKMDMTRLQEESIASFEQEAKKSIRLAGILRV
jgi:fructose-bisphosphate aldolase class II